MAQLFFKTCTGPGHPVDRRLVEGDEVAGFRVLDTPGHSAGHVAFWRESDGVLIAGDVFNTADPFTAIPGLSMPRNYFTPDPPANRRSAKRLGELQPKLLLVGHGPAVPRHAQARRVLRGPAGLGASRTRPTPRAASHWRRSTPASGGPRTG